MNRIRTVVGTWQHGEPVALVVFLASPKRRWIAEGAWTRRVIAASDEEARIIAEHLAREDPADADGTTQA